MEGVGLRPEFWFGKRVFLTGHTGFKGSWLSLWLQELRAQVFGFALEPPTTPSLFEMAGVREGMRSTYGDIRDAAALSRAMHEADPEIVVHMAAQSLVRESYREPAATFATNLQGTVNVLEAVREYDSIRAVVVVTTDKCYEDGGKGLPHTETSTLGGHDPYSSSKACAELATASYRDSFFSGTGTAVATARAGNVIGGGDWAVDRLIPDAVRAWSRGHTLHVRYPAAVRPWQHVLDPLAGYMTLAERLYERGQEFAEAWNFGPYESDSCEVRVVVGRLAGLWGGAPVWEHDTAASPHETIALRLDCAKARNRLGWAPRLSLDEALDWTVAWYRQCLEEKQEADATRDQIRQYQRRLS